MTTLTFAPFINANILHNTKSIMAIQNLTLYSPIYARSSALDFGFSDFRFFNFDLFDCLIYINKDQIIISIRAKTPGISDLQKLTSTNLNYLHNETLNALEKIELIIKEKPHKDIYIISHGAGAFYSGQLSSTILSSYNPLSIMIGAHPECIIPSPNDFFIFNDLDPNLLNFSLPHPNMFLISCNLQLAKLLSRHLYNSLEFYILASLSLN